MKNTITFADLEKLAFNAGQLEGKRAYAAGMGGRNHTRVDIFHDLPSLLGKEQTDKLIAIYEDEASKEERRMMEG